MRLHRVPYLVLVLVAIAAVSLVSTLADERPTDEWLTQPVDDATFRTYLDFFAYDSGVAFDLKRSDVEESQGLRIEDLSFQSTPGVRVTAKVFRLTKSTNRAALRPFITAT